MSHELKAGCPYCLTNLIIRDNLLTPFIGYWWSKSCQFSLMFFFLKKEPNTERKEIMGLTLSSGIVQPLHLLFSSVLIFREVSS